MKERHWREHLDELEKRAAHRARRRANLAKLRERMPPPPPNLFHSAGGSEAAQAWFANLPPEEQSRIVAPSPSGTSSRGRAKVNKAFQQQLVEARSARRALLTIKEWKGIATRYAKRVTSYLAAVQLRCVIIWASIS